MGSFADAQDERAGQDDAAGQTERGATADMKKIGTYVPIFDFV